MVSLSDRVQRGQNTGSPVPALQRVPSQRTVAPYEAHHVARVVSRRAPMVPATHTRTDCSANQDRHRRRSSH